MIDLASHCWPPTRTCRLSVLWAVAVGFLAQFAVPFALPRLGLEKAELIVNPGLLIIVRSTGGWFSGISPLGYVFIFAVNTIIYGALLLAALRMCACLQRWYFSR
jgi:hypothetical protein